MKIEKFKVGRNWTSFGSLSNMCDVMTDCTMDYWSAVGAADFIYGTLAANKSLFCTDISLLSSDFHEGTVYS